MPLATRFLDLVTDKCKYLKINFTNRLDPWDRIQSGFYLQRACTDSTQNHFTSLRTSIRQNDPKSSPAYFINFEDNENLMPDMMKKILDGSAVTDFGNLIKIKYEWFIYHKSTSKFTKMPFLLI